MSEIQSNLNSGLPTRPDSCIPCQTSIVPGALCPGDKTGRFGKLRWLASLWIGLGLLWALVAGMPAALAAEPDDDIIFVDNFEEPVCVETLLLQSATAFPVARRSVSQSYAFSLGAALADFNNNGILDIATVDFGEHKVSILLGNGDGTFQVADWYQVDSTAVVEPAPHAIVAADFNGNGNMDLAVGYRDSGFVGILLGNGDGTFQPPIFPPAIGQRTMLVAEDVNGNGIMDLVVANHHNVGVLVGVGDGTFHQPVIYQINFLNAGVVADLNNNGILDLAVARGTGQNEVITMLGNGDGTFQAAEFSIPAGNLASSMTAADLTGNGRMDLLLANQNSNDVIVMHGNGDGTFEHGDTYPIPWVPFFITARDFNGNGHLDFAVATESPSAIHVFANNGNGTFQSAGPPLAVGPDLRTFASGDLNDNGLLDLVAPDPRADRVQILYGKPDAAFEAPHAFSISPNALVTLSPRTLTAGDFNGNGILDIATSNQGWDQSISIVYGHGDGAFSDLNYFGDIALGITSVFSDDFNGNGILDLGITRMESPHWPPRLGIYLGNGDGSFGDRSLYQPGIGPGIETAVTGDLNNNGHVDIVLAGQGVSYMPGNGTGAYQIVSVIAASPLSVSDVAVADIDGDGNLDIIYTVQIAEEVVVHRGNGDGTFAPAESFELGFRPRAFVVADLNSNGVLDLAVRGQEIAGPSSIKIMLGNVDGTFDEGPSFPLEPAGPLSMVAEDVNGNGFIDLIIGLTGQREVLFLPGSGNGTFETIYRFPAGSMSHHHRSVIVGDFNGNGRLDVATVNTSTDDIAIFPNKGSELVCE